MTKKDIQSIREKFIKDLEDQIWRKELNMAFDLSKIPDIEKLRDGKFKEHTDLTADLAALVSTDHTRETRQKKKELETKIANAESFTLSCDETITSININVQRERQKSSELQARIKFAQDFLYPETESNLQDK